MKKDVVPAIHFPASLLRKAQDIRILIFDVDGVLTDGSLYFDGHGEAFKSFSVLDGQGIAFLRKVGIIVAVISGRDSAALRNRLSALGIEHQFLGATDKLKIAEQLLVQLNIHWDQVAVMGDDWPDLPLMQHAALACTPANGHAQNRALADWVTQERGGQGAARALCDLLLSAQGHYAQLLREFLV